MSECAGCISYGTVCDGTLSTKDIQCPCIKCLVKVVCKDVCEEYGAFKDYVNRINLVSKF